MNILGIRVDELNMEETVAAIDEKIAAFQQGISGAHHVVTINPEGVWLAKNDEALADIVNNAAFVTADGSGILWAAEKLGDPLPQRVTGVDLVEKLCALAAKKGYSVFLLGAVEGVAAQAAEKLCARYEGLKIAGTENGYFKDREQQVIEKISAQKPELLFAALGMPYQEKWLYEHKNELNCGIMIGVGGCFDVISGMVKRAPVFMQKLRLEWLWRLLSDPKRWRRYLVIPRFMKAVKKEARSIREQQ